MRLVSCFILAIFSIIASLNHPLSHALSHPLSKTQGSPLENTIQESQSQSKSRLGTQANLYLDSSLNNQSVIEKSAEFKASTQPTTISQSGDSLNRKISFQSSQEQANDESYSDWESTFPLPQQYKYFSDHSSSFRGLGNGSDLRKEIVDKFRSRMRTSDSKEPKTPTAGIPISYYKQIRPIFQQNCQGCHQPAKPLGGYVMTSYADLLKKGDRDKEGVIPKKPNESFLMEQIIPKNGHAEMPKNLDPLPTASIQLIRQWILEGAKDDSPASALAQKIDASHPPIYRSPPVITAISFSPDSQLIAVSGYHEILIYDVNSLQLKSRLIGLSDRIQSLAFSPDGKWLAASGGDPARFGELQIWDYQKEKLRWSIPVSYDTVYGVSWSPDSKQIACGCADNTLRAFSIENAKQVLFQGAHSDWVLGTSYSLDGNYLISVGRDRTVKLTEIASQRFIDNVTSITPGALKGGLTVAQVRPMKTLKKIKRNEASGGGEIVYNEIIFGGSDGIPRLYKMHRETKRVIGDDANKIHIYPALIGRIYGISANADGSRFVAGSSLNGKGEAKIYEVDSTKVVASLENVPTPIYTTSYRPDGKMVAIAGFDGNVYFYDANNGKKLRQFTVLPSNK